MDRLKYLYGVSLPQHISDTLNASNILPEVAQSMLEPWYQKDAFAADGTPVAYDPDTIYPVYAPRYLQQYIPSSLLGMEPAYSQAAAIAAAKWLEKLLYLSDVCLKHFDGEIFSTKVNGQDYSFCFPVLKISYSKVDASLPVSLGYSRLSAAIIPFPDTRENDEDWDGATVPAYAESQARLTLWCWRQSDLCSRHLSVPTDCFIVRITGNTPGDVMVRTVHSDPQQEDLLVSRLCKAFSKARKADVDPVFNPKIRAQEEWYERRQAEIDGANYIQDPTFYSLVKDYIQYHGIQKACEKEAATIKQQMESIAIRLASETSVNAEVGKAQDVTKKLAYSVSHTRRASRPATISAALLNQFYPEYLDCVITNEYPRGRVTIEADE